MMLALDGVKLCDLRNQSIISLASDLGCEIEYPRIPENKYWCEIAEKINNKEEIDNELQMKFEKEIEKNNKKFDKIFNDYMESLVDWLDDNGYIKDR